MATYNSNSLNSCQADNKQLLLSFLETHLQENDLQSLIWVDNENGIFAITYDRYSRNASKNIKPNHVVLEWSRYRNHESDVTDYVGCKARLRNALNKCIKTGKLKQLCKLENSRIFKFRKSEFIKDCH